MRVLITGASGFVGSNLCLKLISMGYEVHALIKNGEANIPTDVINHKIVLHEYNGTFSSIDEIFSKNKIDIVFHLASLFIVEHKEEDLDDLILSNVLLGTHLAEAMTKNKILKLINTGTSWQHYNNSDYNPVNLYAATKQAFEDILKYYHESNGLSVITLKLFDTYGANDKRPKLFNLLLKSSNNKNKIELSEGDQYLNLVYIDDVIDAFIVACQMIFESDKKYFESFVISNEIKIKLKDLIKLFEDISKTRLDVLFGAKPYRRREVFEPWTEGKVLPNWKVKISLDLGIKKILNM